MYIENKDKTISVKKKKNCCDTADIGRYSFGIEPIINQSTLTPHKQIIYCSR